MRIALLSHYPDDETAPAGGVWGVGRHLAAGLVAAGAQVHVVRYVASLAGSEARTVVTGQPPLVVHTVLLPRRRSQPVVIRSSGKFVTLSTGRSGRVCHGKRSMPPTV